MFEAKCLNVSSGFRPGRSAHDAIDKLCRSIPFERQDIVIDADLTTYFDSIRQALLMERVERRISDPRVLRRLWKWGDAGVMDDGRDFKATEFGTPQGAVMSPLLANSSLHSVDTMCQLSGIPGTRGRYADDFVILLRSKGQAVVEWARRMLTRLGGTLHPNKTRIVHAKEGVDFLGMHFRLRPVRKRGAKLTYSCRRWPSDRSMTRGKTRIKEGIGRRDSLSPEDMRQELNPTIRGWEHLSYTYPGRPKAVPGPQSGCLG